MKLQLENQNYNKNILNEQEGNNIIRSYFQKKEPFFVSKAANIACEIAAHTILLKDMVPNRLKHQALENMGVYPNDDKNLITFAENYCQSITNVDIMGVWVVPYYDWLVNTYCPKAHYLRLWGLEPYHFNNPWSEFLENKKVLVIHPFEQSIINNYRNRNKIFPDSKVLPEFSLKTIKAEQNLGNVNTNFFDTVERTKNKITQIDFDVAIIGCGAAGLPLGSFIKSIGKTAIHLGGATQVLFGIIGKRWEDYPQFKNIINEYWTRPLPEETPFNYLKIENGCYW
jgi:hypothetical protein